MVTGSLADKQLADELHVSPAFEAEPFCQHVKIIGQVRITDLIEKSVVHHNRVAGAGCCGVLTLKAFASLA